MINTLLRWLGWSRASTYILSCFVAVICLIVYIWWPLAEEYLATYNPQISFWQQMDWLLLGIFVVMSILIMAHADLKHDLPIVFIGLAGGLVIEAWGTQTNLWRYYTFERPPLWIIPAWPIASLSIDRLYRAGSVITWEIPNSVFNKLYWLLFPGFLGLMLWFVWPTREASLTLTALFLCVFLILTPVNPRAMVITFLVGAGLGYFLEYWGTTRLCWIYYTEETPPGFAVLAHGMAAVAFWRVLILYKIFQPRLIKLIPAYRWAGQKQTILASKSIHQTDS